MKDRFHELQQQIQVSDTRDPTTGKDSVEVNMNSAGDSAMKMFLDDASKVEAELTMMKADVAEIKKLQQNMLSNPFVDKKDITKYESLGEKVRNNAAKIGDSLKQLERKFDSQLPEDSTFKRVRTQQLNSLTTALNIQTNEFFKIQSEYMEKMKANLRRQLIARGDSVEDSKISTILDHDSYSVFTDNYITNVNDAELTLRNLEDRKKDILALEKSVTDVNHLFKELNLLVSSQGETLNRVESAIDNTVVHVQTATIELKKAKEWQGKARRKKICIIVIIVVILVIIAIILAIVLGTKN